jgi:hypothetical protein
MLPLVVETMAMFEGMALSSAFRVETSGDLDHYRENR